MTEFKAGDRVEYQNGIEKDPANGTLGTVLDADDPYARVHVEWDTRAPLPSPGTYPLTSHLRLVKPQKATPAVGDIVRVVLEGEVAWHPDEDGDFTIRSNDAENWIVSGARHVKSIEIITPAKPSVTDLPVGSVIRSSGGFIYEKTGPDAWRATGHARHFTNEDLDSNGGWALMVPKGSE